MRQSIQATYDRCETGDRFTVETRLNGHRISMEGTPDPFVNTTIRVGWRDRLRCLFSGLAVTVVVGGDREIVEDVIELNNDYTGRHDSTRRVEWNAQMQGSLEDFAARLAEHDEEAQRD